MPEIATIEFLRSLEILEDDAVLTTGLRSHYYEVINKTINSTAEVDEDDIKKILTICCHDLSEHISLIPFILNTISAIIKRVNTLSGSELYLVEPAMSVINVIKTTVLASKSEVLRIQAFEILLSFPKETLLTVAESYTNDVIEIFKLFNHLAIPIELRYKTIQILHRFLTVIPLDKRECFVKSYVDLWFLKIIPFAIKCIGKPESYMDVEMLIEVLEYLADALADVDYVNDSSWLEFLECIYNPKKYPTLMKTLLQSKTTKVVWHRLWMVLVKLLKDQITLSKNNKGSPINAMLPTVETAFKLDSDSRCKAFECWNCLIDNFSAEKNKLYIDKRIKLLVIPLTSNNARVEDIAVSKQETWWHLIKQFQLVSHKLYDSVIIPYLHFCFGKHDSKKFVVVGTMTEQLKMFSLQTLAELTGHSATCKCEISVEKLSDRLLNSSFLVNYWNDWIQAMKTAIWISSELDEQAAQLLSCIWTSFLTVMADLPPNNIRRDLFSDLLLLIVKSEKEAQNMNLFHMTFGVIRPILLMDERFSQLLPISEGSDLDILVLSIFNLEYSKEYFKGLNHDSKDSSLEYLYYFILSIPLHSNVIELLIGKMSCENYLPLWNILAEVLLDPKFSKSTDDVVIKVLTWVVKSMNNMQLAGTYTRKLWQDCYLKHADVNLCQEVLGVLQNYKMFAVLDCEVQKFIITAVVSCLLPCWSLPTAADYDFVQSILCKISRYEDVEDQLTMLMNPIKNISTNTDVTYNSFCKNIKYILLTLKHMLILIIKFFDKTPNDVNLAIHLQSIINFFEIVLNKYHKDLNFLHEICEILLELAQKLPASAIKEIVFVFLRDTTKNFDPNDPKVQKVQDIFHVQLRKKDGSYVHKNRKTNIVNTVVENGEEFVVIKSNWKFNPKKLTENQKEKFKRKREDIPALYQDLSQSQDDSKITAWKTDSQDTSLSSSKSNSKTDNQIVPAMLKDALGAEIVPTIIDVISGDDGKSNNATTNNQIKKTTPLHATAQKEKRVHSMALKVIKNVRNLMEKSGFQNIEGPTDNLNVTVRPDTPISPISSKNVNEGIINSTPIPTASDRPSRVKKTPKKYEDSLLTGRRKKLRHSCRSRSPSPIDNSACHDSGNTHVLLNKTLEKKATNKDEESKGLNTSENNEPSKFSEKRQEENSENSIKIGKDTEQITIVNDNKNKNDEDTLCNDTITSEKYKEDVSTESLPSTKKDDLIMIPECTSAQNQNKQETSTPSIKKKTSRIVKELKIDMVAGHPYLQQPSEKRTPRKCVVNSTSSTNSAKKKKNTDKAPRAVVEQNSSIIVNESQDKLPGLDEFPMSEDIIESSQDSTMTTVSVKSSKSKKNAVVAMDDDSQVKNRTRTPSPKNETIKNCPTKSDATLPVVIVRDILSPSLRKKPIDANSKTKADQTRDLIDLFVAREKTPSPHKAGKRNVDPVLNNAPLSETREINTIIKYDGKIVKPNEVPPARQIMNSKITSSIVLLNENNASKEDTVFTQNKTAVSETQEGTENMDTEPTSSSDVIIITDEIVSPIVVESEVLYVGPETQELADADTLTLDSNFSLDHGTCEITNASKNLGKEKDPEVKSTLRLSGIPVKDCDGGGLSSPYKDDEQRQQDFLNNTLEISPIKIASPAQDTNTATLPKSNSDYVLIKLSSPVHSNGEPYENMDSPEIFTNDKTSPDKRNQSPPREEVPVMNTSPSLSLKKNRNQVRPSGRAAQMLGLCVPDKLQLVVNSELTVDSEETRKTSTLNTLAKRNLRKLYNTNDNYDSSDENEDAENFLKFKRLLPNAESSPSGPILKRKLADMVDEAIASPVSKRKRVSFHDPPVSTTVSVLKYIEPNGLRSPQNSASKKLERQNRVQTNMKSQKRLDNVFKLDTVLTKALESFTENKTTTNDDSQLSSLEQTPAAEIVKSSDLNDSDPICPDLIECRDPIANIATELSSPCMRSLLIKELEGKIDTIGDLAKLTELEINRLCIKSPKVKITRKVLNDYLLKISKDQDQNNQIMEVDISVDMQKVESENNEPIKLIDQSKIVETNEMEMQTETTVVNDADTQTINKITNHSQSQTEESGFKPTADIIKTLLLERSDFMEELNNNLDDTRKSMIAQTLTFKQKLDVVLEKPIGVTSTLVLNEQLKPKLQNNKKELTFLQDLMSNRYTSKDLILFCSKLLQNIHERREDDAL